MTSYSSEAPQYLFKVESRFENREYLDYVVAFDHEWAAHKYKSKYPNVKEIKSLTMISEVII